MRENVKLLALFVLFPLVAFAQWTPITALPGNGTDGCFAVTIEGKGYVGGGTGRRSLYEYNPISGGWTKKADIPGPTQRAWSGSFVVDSKLYIIGGDSTFGGLLKDVWMYDPTTDKWQQKADFPGGRRDGMFCWSMTVNSKTKVYVGGGFDGQSILGDFYEYDPVTDIWETVPDNLPAAVLFPSSFVINNKGYLTFWEGGGFFNNLWEFDPVDGSWTERAACPGVARGEGIGFAINGKGYAGMGQTNFNKAYTDLYEYDPAKDQWTKMTDVFPDQHAGWSTSFVIGSIVFAGTGVTLPDFDFSNKFYKKQINNAGVSDVYHSGELIVYPNPVCDKLFFSTGIYSGTISIYDNSGRLVYNIVAKAERSIDVSSFQTGLYWLMLEGASPIKLSINN